MQVDLFLRVLSEWSKTVFASKGLAVLVPPLERKPVEFSPQSHKSCPSISGPGEAH